MSRKQRLPFKRNTESNIQDERKYPAITNRVAENKATLQEVFHNSTDIKFREFQIPLQNVTGAFLCYMEGMVSEDSINLNIMEPLLEASQHLDNSSDEVMTFIKNRIVQISDLSEVTTTEEMVNGIMVGKTAVIVEGSNKILLINTIRYDARAVEEPDTESTVRGPREGFTEVLKTNTSLIRRRVKNPNLVFEDMEIGKLTKTIVRIGYIEGIAKEEVVKEVKKRLKSIETDSILGSGYIEQFIEDGKNSPFPTVGNSEKSDKVAAKILEGRVAIICDGTPFVLTVPFLFIEAFQVPEDYYSKYFITSFIRLIRVLALFLTVLTPALFVAAATFHQEMVPTLLLTTMAAAEEKVPFPVLIEALLMIVVFQLLREAGVRMPRPIGSAISIVGALVIGEATVQAGLVGAPMVIVVAITAITGFIIPVLNNPIILVRYFLLFLAGSLGLYGLLMGILVVIAHVCSLRSFGVPYLTPIAPVVLSEWRDFPLRLPIKFMKKKPHSTVETNKGDVSK
ncbi:spore germination protein [Gracilibacillus oryzae]|uniref:Spore germination protein n=1 Tax=Gracilibacillus oryzae TaxID=1672701 RepID=A0A7C8KZR4_9BACI|nr:spore germination protein [Gracilibacillus oryzae]KAB8137548.1 spore germination protein [Gracilibacillus oryzae]